MPRKLKIEWVVWDAQTAEVLCLRCGEREKPKLPIPLDAFCIWLDYFQAKHQHCEPSNSTPADSWEKGQNCDPGPCDGSSHS